MVFIDTFEYNIKNKINFAFARFNDGEISVISGSNQTVSRGGQEYTESMRECLTKAIRYNEPGYYKGVPCGECYPGHNKKFFEFIHNKKYLVPATSLCNNDHWKRVWKVLDDVEREYIWIGGFNQHLKKLPFDVREAFPVHAENCFDVFRKTLQGVYKRFYTDDVILISAGPLSRYLAFYYFKQRQDITVIDIGSIFDPLTKGIKYRYHKGTLPYCPECNFQ